MPGRSVAFSLKPSPTEKKEWSIKETKLDLDRTAHFETIFTLANGNLSVRGSLEYALHLGSPGSYMAGLFDASPVDCSELVNLPGWIGLRLTLGGKALGLETGKVLAFRRILDMKQGILFHLLRWRDPKGRVTRYESARLVHLARPDLAVMWGRIVPEDWSGNIVLESALDGNVWNATSLPQVKVQHLLPNRLDGSEGKGLILSATTRDTGIPIGIASRLETSAKSEWDLGRQAFGVSERLSIDARKGRALTFTKLVACNSGRSTDRPAPTASKSLTVARSTPLEDLIAEHTTAWAKRWEDSDMVIEGDRVAQQAVRFNLFHLNQLGDPRDGDVSIGSGGLHGEGHGGHVFRDVELCMLPFFIYTWPKAARSLLLYRCNRLPAARDNALIDGRHGAKFPWESADAGGDVTPLIGGEILTGEGPTPRHDRECRHHVTADIAYGFTHYCSSTGDETFYREIACQLLLETALFWGSRVELDEDNKRYVIKDVTPPDGFHSHVDNSVYTNYMASWNLRQGLHAAEYLRQNEPTRLRELESELGINDRSYRFWRKVASRLFVIFDPETSLYEQHEGYFQLKEVELTRDSSGRPSIPEEYRPVLSETQILEQADVLLLMYILPDRFPLQLKKANYAFYEPRTSHTSPLSLGVHTIMGIEVRAYENVYQNFLLGARMELSESANSPDGIHAANLGNTWQVVVNGFAGLRTIKGELHFRPWLPPEWKGLSFRLFWRGEQLDVTIQRDRFRALLHSDRRRAVIRVYLFDDWLDVTHEGIDVPMPISSDEDETE